MYPPVPVSCLDFGEYVLLSLNFRGCILPPLDFSSPPSLSLFLASWGTKVDTGSREKMAAKKQISVIETTAGAAE